MAKLETPQSHHLAEIEMSEKKSKPRSKKKEISVVRSSAVEYPTFVASSGQEGDEVVYAEEDDLKFGRALCVARDFEFYRYQVKFELIVV